MYRNVFVLEDHDVVRETIITLIDLSPGLQVCGSAASAEEALPLVASAQPDVLLVDISLPGMNGLEFVEHLRDADALPPTIMVTGHSHPTYRKRAMQAGARSFVDKGNGLHTLPAEIERVLEATEVDSSKVSH